MIPDLEDDGHLPPGRFRCTVDEVFGRFVDHSDFTASVTRRQHFTRLIEYLNAWSAIERKAGESILRSIWIGGSFTSNKVDPRDLDATPVIDGPAADRLAGKPGSGSIKKLTRHRDSVVREYGIEPFPIIWHPVVRPFSSEVAFSIEETEYLQDRGMLDDWWQRHRDGDSDIPTIASCETRRGYLEVIP